MLVAGQRPAQLPGKILVIVDSTFVVPLAAELTQLRSDLAAEGWGVFWWEVSRTESPANIRAEIIALQAQHPTLEGVYLVGHVPVPYSGNFAPDAHNDHQGAWPADFYYGELTLDWTDTLVNNTTAARTANHNVPGDGKFDLSSMNIFGAPDRHTELFVGRVDFNDLPAFPESDTTLLRNYLNKAHAYKTAQWELPLRGLVEDNFGLSTSEPFAANGWRTFPKFFGPDSAQELDFNTLRTEGYTWAYGTGGGTYTSAGGVVSTNQLRDFDYQMTFSMLFGSYHGDWDSPNNLMRAALAGSSRTLSCAWAGRPNWWFHPMALGEPIGLCQQLSASTDGGLSDSYVGGGSALGVHIALMGDPSLRYRYPMPLTSISANGNEFQAELSWAATPDADGYMVYRREHPDSAWLPLTASPIVGTAFTDDFSAPPSNPCEDCNQTFTYLVLPVRLDVTGSGSYWNHGLGATDSASVDFTTARKDLQVIALSLAPNPATRVTRLTAPAPIESLELLDLYGRVLRNWAPNTTSVALDRGNLAAGVYLVRARTATGTGTVRVVFE